MNKATVQVRPALLALTLASAGLILAACGGGGTTTVPVAPTNVVATPGPGYVTVTWTDNSDNETGFQVFRTATTGITTQQTGSSVGTVGANTTGFVDMNVELEQEYHYSVVAANAAGSSGASATTAGAKVQVGVDLMVGTSNRHWEDANGTIFVTYLMLPDTLLTDDTLTFNFQISGPPGWNGDAPRAFNCGSDNCALSKGFTWGSWNQVTALAGEYTLTVTVDGQVYTATATLTDPTFTLDRPTDINVTNATTGSVTGTWSLPVGADASFLALHEGDFGATQYARTVGAVEEYTFEELTLADGVYTFEVIPVNSDVFNYPLKVEPFGLSYDGVQFLVGEALAPACASADQVVTIPDDALLQAVRDTIGRPTGDLTCLDMALLVTLYAPDRNIASLEGLEYAANLGDIFMDNNDVSDVSPLADLTSLWSLNLNVNEVTNVAPLSNLTNLTELHLCCTAGNITDVSPLEGLTNMVGLNLSLHHLGDAVLWPLLQNYPALRKLWISDNDLTDFAQLADHPELEILHIGGHTIADLTPVANLSELYELQIPWSEVADITPLYGMTQLSYLNIEGIGVSDIDFLEEFEQLSFLYMANNQATSLAPLVANVGLGAGDYVDVRVNQLDLTDPAVQADIQTLRDRGVNLVTD